MADSIKEKAKRAAAYFTTRKTDGVNVCDHVRCEDKACQKTWYVFADGKIDSDDETYNALSNIIHDTGVSVDCAYSMIVDCLDQIENLDDDATADDARELVDEQEAPCYTHDLTAWLHEDVQHVYYLTEAIKEYAPGDVFQAFTMAWICAWRDVSMKVIEMLEAME